ncbi:unnamed protein product [Withania somnifera]
MWLKNNFIICATLFYHFSIVYGCYEIERAAFLSFKSLLTDPPNWLFLWQSQSCCNWKGIKCSSSGRVVVVNLRNPNPIEVMININKEVVLYLHCSSLLTDHMQHLDLSFNNFMYSKLPVEILNLTKLTYLNLSKAMFRDTISTQFTNLTSLRSLDLSCANLVSDLSSVSVSLTFPLILTGVDLSKASESFRWAKSISCLSNLLSLQLSNCNISGRIPIRKLLNLTSLSTLAMSSNILTSSIPDLLSNITTLDLVSMFSDPWPKLMSLDISFTRVGGTIPSSVSNSTSLTFFRSDGCSIRGSIPSSITKLKKLSVLTLNDYDITGQLPVSLSSLTSFQYVSLFQNRLEGHIPVSIFQIPFLEFNDLTGHLQLCILQLPKLSSLYIQRNRLDGNIPFSLFRKSRLDEISLGTSRLSVEIDDHDQSFVQAFQPKILECTSCNMRGDIPDFFSNFTSLEVLNFANNSLFGAIPQWLFNLPALSILSLPMNNFKGFIPPMIQLKSSLFPTIVNLARNKLQGPIPTQLENVNVIDLSLNNFVGSIPACIAEAPGIRSVSLSGNKIHGNCKSLIYLNLGQNKLTGSVPNELEGITSLRCLDLNGNQFEELLTKVIENFQDLEILNLADNRFEGRIPRLMKLENLLYIGLSRNNLSGSIPENLDGLKMMKKTEKQATILGYVYSLKFSGAQLEISVYSYNTGFDISSNALTGKIPEKIGVLSGFPLLNLSHNNLYGLIPKTIVEMISLEEIELLDFLQHLNMSYNNLSRKNPSSQHFDTLYQDGTTYIGKKYLCAIFFGYVTGISGLFLLLYLMKDSWRNRYWRQ